MNTRPTWPATAARAPDWPRGWPQPGASPGQARGSLRFDLALREASGAPAGRSRSRSLLASDTAGGGGHPWGGLRYGGIWAGMALALLRLEEQKPQLPPPPPPPKGGNAMSMMRLVASGYSAKAESVSTMSAYMYDYGEDV